MRVFTLNPAAGAFFDVVGPFLLALILEGFLFLHCRPPQPLPPQFGPALIRVFTLSPTAGTFFNVEALFMTISSLL
jgi:hypothetical protein